LRADLTTLYLGSHHATNRWWALGVPLFVSVRVLKERKRLPYAFAPWALDSGGFTELLTYGKWQTSEAEYVRHIWRLRGIGRLAWVAPQDWMCEPEMIARTGLTVREHQERTVSSFVSLREQLGALVVPVLQGYSPREYDRCVSLYQDAGIDLQAEPLVGLGSVCKRSRTKEAVRLVRYPSDHKLRLHGFGLKGDTFLALRGLLASADSMAWSYGARRAGRNANSITEATAWREKLLAA
jgi:hypothetical protein